MDDKMAFLTNSILKSRDVMKAVESKTYRKGSIDPSKLITPNNVNENMQQPYLGTPPIQTQATQPTYNPKNLERSKMPREIIESFRNNPPIASQGGQIGLSFLDEIAGNINNRPQESVYQPQQSQQAQPVYNQAPAYQQPVMGGGMNELQLEGLKSVIEKIVRETMEKVFDEREKLTESAALNENIQLKIGESIFSGKITGVKTIKK